MAGGFDPKKFSLVPFVKRVEKPWGYEIIYTPDDAPATGKILHVNAGKRLSLQYHDVKRETLCLISGEAIITLSNDKDEQVEVKMELHKGYHVVPGQVHRVTAVTDIDFIEASTPELGNTFRLQDDSNRATETEEIRKQENRGWKKS
ncbi:MAG: Cupin 2 conserved barrel domain protein [Candidatus Gottesmanbacteria bacterium GW2011_GWA1_47_8]|uniref:Cupin 2 conserved barrel domain protein n=1 Tax=Candidatus Gottesmanbacteria bacterium GW2011_GWA1_47_8 TaxID=1618438 RepID=A0A0G1WFE7_9BACT|nr:MAG: Cupin 2 conserved barrel domain protein [Candidatus Gottesmanbacteria bacterium GW2011_GWA1_47_8]